MSAWEEEGVPTGDRGLYLSTHLECLGNDEARDGTIPFPDAVGGAATLNYILELNLEDISPSKMCHPLSTLSALRRSLWVHDYKLIDFYGKMF